MPSGRGFGFYVAVGLIVLALAQSAFAADLLEVVKGNKDLTMFVKAVEAAGLADTLKGPGPYTIFAPTDDAFKKLSNRRQMLMMAPRNKKKLAALLKYHMINGAWPTDKITEMRSGSLVDTLEGKKIAVIYDSTGIFINGAKVVTPDMKASNGMIQMIDTVLLPPRR